MKRLLGIPLFVLLTFLFSFWISPSSIIYADEHRYIVGFHGEIDEELIRKYEGTIEYRLESIRAVSTIIAEDKTKQLKKYRNISFIEKDMPIQVAQQSIDWGVQQINAPAAWANGLTGKGVKVAVIDTGVAKHPDLNIKEGVSFVNYTSSYFDDSGHGTHVAGIIGALNNEQGVVGVAHEADLYAIKVLDKSGNGFHSSVIKGIEWAVDRGVDIINLSVGGSEQSNGLEKALENAYNKGVLIVAAAGNKGNFQGRGDTVEYPAAYPTVIAVAATDQSDRRASFSATGIEVEIAAPGVAIRSTHLNDQYERISGTSMAAPHVTGHLALLKQARPDATHTELRRLLQEQALNPGVAGRDRLLGYGRIHLPSDFKREPMKPKPPEQFTITISEKTTDGAKLFLQWNKPSGTAFITGYRLYKNGEAYKDFPSGTLTFLEQVPMGEHRYSMSTIGEEGIESERTAAKIIMIEEKENEEKNPNSGSNLIINFHDVYENDWFASYIYKLYKDKIIFGYSDSTIRPKETITRAEAAVMLQRALKLSGQTYTNLYPDVPAGHYAASAIQVMAESGLVSGYPDGRFRPNASITRGEVAALLNRAYEINAKEKKTFIDISSNYFGKAAVEALAGAGLATGYPDGTYQPHAPITRGEFAALLARTMEYEK